MTTKKSILLVFANIILLAVIFLGCSKENQQQQNIDLSKEVIVEDFNSPYFQEVTIDSCQYILYRKWEGGNYSFSSGLCHKGNCKFCSERCVKH